jgi:hypothetical protein
MTEDETEELIRLRIEARLFNDALYASVRDYQILKERLRIAEEKVAKADGMALTFLDAMEAIAENLQDE